MSYQSNYLSILVLNCCMARHWLKHAQPNITNQSRGFVISSNQVSWLTLRFPRLACRRLHVCASSFYSIRGSSDWLWDNSTFSFATVIRTPFFNSLDWCDKGVYFTGLSCLKRRVTHSNVANVLIKYRTCFRTFSWLSVLGRNLAVMNVILEAHFCCYYYGHSLLILFSSRVVRNTSKTFAALLKTRKWNLCAKFSTTDLSCFLAVIQTVKSTRTSSKSLQSTQRYP